MQIDKLNKLNQINIDKEMNFESNKLQYEYTIEDLKQS
jgi:hypothetical protein